MNYNVLKEKRRYLKYAYYVVQFAHKKRIMRHERETVSKLFASHAPAPISTLLILFILILQLCMLLFFTIMESVYLFLIVIFFFYFSELTKTLSVVIFSSNTYKLRIFRQLQKWLQLCLLFSFFVIWDICNSDS